ncbi:TlpA family protein disulfide reductase [Mariniblastus fucicola]|uniref:Thiol-disulfide oxidoreductase n=1 Tax=Mariniblastus fucicola TaxID=980251 RepID=A0A5B9PIG8_9BACT|nr:TlpA disulfide reductase family protein [Mariniblastus fucicola]QEG24476.1 thiol-disulfide oxidoreductase [Mariniblastus fucicola]
MLRLRLFAFLFAALLSAATTINAQEGLWDAQLDSPGGPIRFGLKLERSSEEHWSAWLVNGSEQIEVPSVKLADNGNLVLSIDHYDSQLSLVQVPKTDVSDTSLTGTWKKRRKANQWVEMSLNASLVKEQKPDQTAAPLSFDGRWKVKFSSSDSPAVGIFKSDAKTNVLSGTFLTTTGDYRFLAGSVVEDSMELSCFDGAHAFLFKAKQNDDGSLTGDFWSSNTWHETWTATRDKDAQLPDSFQLTTATAANINTLSFPDLNQNETRLDDDRFAAPVRIIHIFGSWCPNCHDAGKYLAELKAKYGNKISVVGIAFELTGDANRDAVQVRKYLKRHGLDHPVLIGGGSSSKDKASEAMTIIDEVRSYPTTVFANKDGKIVAVHQGFSGPATGEAYTALKSGFEAVIEGILTSNK